jgi:hypothetical protein
MLVEIHDTSGNVWNRAYTTARTIAASDDFFAVTTATIGGATVTFRKKNGIVEMDGFTSTNTAWAALGTISGTVPAGYRPIGTTYCLSQNSTGACGFFSVNTSGAFYNGYANASGATVAIPDCVWLAGS